MNAGTDRPEAKGPPAFFLAVAILVLLHIGVTCWFSLARYDSLKSHLHDTGLIGQSFWSTTQGRFFVNSVNPEAGRSEYYFGNHFTPIYFLIAPLYWLFPTPKTLLILQSILLGLGAIPVFGLARFIFDNARAGLAFAILYLLHPALWFANLYDFHTEAISGTFILYAILYLEIGAWPQFWIAATLAMACKEQVSLVFFMLGLVLALDPRNRKRGLILSAVSLTVFLVVMTLIIPAFAGTSTHPYVAERYGHLGNSLPQVVWATLTRPLDVAAQLTSGRHLYYLACLLGPLLFLPLGAPLRLAIGLPTFLANVLSAVPITHDIGFYHSASILPGMFWAAMYASGPVLCKLGRWFKKIGPRGWTALLLVNALFWHARTQSAILPGHFPPLSPSAHRTDYDVGEHENLIRELQAQVPEGASLSVQFNLASHFTNRFGLYQFPNRVGDVEYILVDLTEPYRKRPAEYRRFWLEFMIQVKIPRYLEAVRELLRDSRYGLLFSRDGYLLFHKGAVDSTDRDAARQHIEAVGRLWESYTGRGYGVEKRRWDAVRPTMDARIQDD